MPADRLAHGYRWEDEQWKDEPLLANGSFGSMGGMLTSLSRPRAATSARFSSAWPPRDGAETAPIRRSSLREMQQLWRPGAGGGDARRGAARVQLNAGGYGFGLRISQTCTFPPRRRAQRRPAGLRVADALAAGVRRRHHRVRQPHLHRLGPRRSTRRSTRSRRPAACSRGRSQPSPALVAARDDGRAASSSKWDDAVADRIAAENLFLDQSKDRRRAEIEALHATGRRVPPGERVRLRRERAARRLDDDLRARQAAGGDHARADDAAEGAVHVDPARTGGYAENGDVPALTVGRRRFLKASASLLTTSAAFGLYTWKVEPHWLEISHQAGSRHVRPLRLAEVPT